MDSTIRRLSTQAITNKTNEYGIVEIGVEEDTDLGYKIKDSLLPNMVL
jgi:hypothetical protein